MFSAGMVGKVIGVSVGAGGGVLPTAVDAGVDVGSGVFVTVGTHVPVGVGEAARTRGSDGHGDRVGPTTSESSPSFGPGRGRRITDTDLNGGA